MRSRDYFDPSVDDDTPITRRLADRRPSQPATAVRDSVPEARDDGIDLPRVSVELLHDAIGGPGAIAPVSETPRELVLLGEVQLILMTSGEKMEPDAQP
jgi:hypothetical protein